MVYHPNYEYPDPQNLYDPDPLIQESFLRDYGDQIWGTMTGIGLMASVNFLKRKPLISGLHYYAASVVGTVGAWMLVHKIANLYYTRRDQIHRHYVKLHPEDFPPLKKVKIGELLEDWSPVR